MKRIGFLFAGLLLAAAAGAAEVPSKPSEVSSKPSEAPLKPSEADLVSKLFQLSLASEGAHVSPAARDDAPLSDAEYKAICRDLESVSGIELTRNEKSVRVVGEIVDADEWSLYRRVVRRYAQLVSDYVVFRPGPKLINSLRQQIVSLGFEVVDAASPDRPGTVSFSYEAGLLRIEGWFLSKADIEAVRGVVAMRRWLSTEPNAADGTVPCELRLRVVDRLIDVGVVFVLVNKSDAERFGNMVADGKILDFQSAMNFAKSYKDFIPSLLPSYTGQGNGGYVRVSSDINAVIEAYAQNRVFRSRSSGHTTLNTNDMDQRSKFHKGGKMILKISGEVTGGNIEEVEYGLTIDCLGRFIRNDELALDIKLEQSTKPEKEQNSPDYDQKKTDLTTHISCRLGQTVILAGAHEVSDDINGPTGFAFLRKIPIVGWFAAGGSEDRTDEHYLILISPTLLASDTQLAEKPSAENEKLDDEVKPTLKRDVEDEVGVWRWYEIFYFWKWGF